MTTLADEILKQIENETIPNGIPQVHLPKRIDDLRRISEDRWAEYTATSDIGAADIDDRFAAYEKAREAYIDACDSFRADPATWWLAQDEEDSLESVSLF
jgi:hypothetical protein